MRRGVVLRSAWKMGRGYFFSDSKKQAWSLLTIVVSLNLFLVYITVELNIWQGNFYQVLQLKDEMGFLEAIGIYAGLAVILIVVKGAQTYFRLLLQTAVVDTKKEYPYLALKRGETGRVEVLVRLNIDGSLDAAEIVQSSGVKSLDAGAIKAVEKTCPFSHGAGRMLEFIIPIYYELS